MRSTSRLNTTHDRNAPRTAAHNGTLGRIGDVADEPLTQCAAVRVELTPDPVRQGHRLLTRQSGHLVGPRLYGFQAELAHQVSDQADTALVPLAVQLRRHPPAPRGLPRIVEHPADVAGQLAPPGRGRRFGPAAPFVVARPGHRQQLAHERDREIGLLRLDERAALRY
jgi:hypothetical protein